MAALSRGGGGRRHKNIALKGRTMAEAIKAGNFYELTGPKGYNYSPPAATRPGEVLIWARRRWLKEGVGKARAGLYQIWRIVGGSIGARVVEPVQAWYFDGKKWEKAKRKNPLSRKEAISELKYARSLSRLARGFKSHKTEKGALRAARYYGKAEGVASVVVQSGKTPRIRRQGAGAMATAGRAGIKTYEHLTNSGRRRRNPPALRYIGSNVTVVASGKTYSVGGKIFGGPSEHEATIVCSLGKGHTIPLGARVSRIEYDNKEKAIRAYGKPGRFYHNFTSETRVYMIRSGVMSFKREHRTPREIILRSSATLWRAQK